MRCCDRTDRSSPAKHDIVAADGGLVVQAVDVGVFRARDAEVHEVGDFFFNDPATTEIYTLSLHDALPIYRARRLLFLHEVAVARSKRTQPGERIAAVAGRYLGRDQRVGIGGVVVIEQIDRHPPSTISSPPMAVWLSRPLTSVYFVPEMLKFTKLAYFFLMIRRPPRSTPFPPTTLFRSTEPAGFSSCTK